MEATAAATPTERIEMVGVLSRRAWELTGKPFPAIPRRAWPAVVIRPS